MTEIVFGRGALARLGAFATARPVLVTTPRRRFAEQVPVTDVIDLAADHCPAPSIDAALVRLPASADGVIALGGGSAIGLAKALADARDLPLIAVPTSFAGSALTDSYGVTTDGEKQVRRSERARAHVAIYDSALFDGFGGPAASASAFNAMAHAADALFGDISPVLRDKAVRAIGKLAQSLPIEAGPKDAAVEGAMLAAQVLAEVGAGLHHRMCHLIGGRFATPHGATHAVMLPYTSALRRGTEGSVWLSGALAGDDPAMALYALGIRCGLPRGLHALGVPEEAIDDLSAPLAAAGFDLARARALLLHTWRGEPPIDPDTDQ